MNSEPSSYILISGHDTGKGQIKLIFLKRGTVSCEAGTIQIMLHMFSILTPCRSGPELTRALKSRCCHCKGRLQRNTTSKYKHGHLKWHYRNIDAFLPICGLTIVRIIGIKLVHGNFKWCTFLPKFVNSIPGEMQPSGPRDEDAVPLDSQLHFLPEKLKIVASSGALVRQTQLYMQC